MTHLDDSLKRKESMWTGKIPFLIWIIISVIYSQFPSTSNYVSHEGLRKPYEARDTNKANERERESLVEKLIYTYMYVDSITNKKYFLMFLGQ